MSFIKISELTRTTTIQDTDLIPIAFDSGGETYSASKAIQYQYIKSNGLGLYRTKWIGASNLISSATNGATLSSDESATNKVNNVYLEFDPDVNQFAQIGIVMPEEWDRDTIKIKFFWTADSGSGDVVWYVDAQAVSNDDPIDGSWGSAATVTDTLTAVGDVDVTAATGAMTVGGTPAVGDVIYFRVYRVATSAGDTLAANAKLIGIYIQYKEGSTAPSAW